MRNSMCAFLAFTEEHIARYSVNFVSLLRTYIKGFKAVELYILMWYNCISLSIHSSEELLRNTDCAFQASVPREGSFWVLSYTSPLEIFVY